MLKVYNVFCYFHLSLTDFFLPENIYQSNCMRKGPVKIYFFRGIMTCFAIFHYNFDTLWNVRSFGVFFIFFVELWQVSPYFITTLILCKMWEVLASPHGLLYIVRHASPQKGALKSAIFDQNVTLQQPKTSQYWWKTYTLFFYKHNLIRTLSLIFCFFS